MYPSAAEQQRVYELEQQLRETQSRSSDEIQKLRQALTDRQGALQVLQSQHAEAEKAAADLRQGLAQQAAEKDKLRQQLHYLEAEQANQLDAQSRELTSLNRSLQGQVHVRAATHHTLCVSETADVRPSPCVEQA